MGSVNQPRANGVFIPGVPRTVAGRQAAIERYRETDRCKAVESGDEEPSVKDAMEYQFYRFLEGASDDFAIRGWRYIMRQRQHSLAAAGMVGS